MIFNTLLLFLAVTAGGIHGARLDNTSAFAEEVTLPLAPQKTVTSVKNCELTLSNYTWSFNSSRDASVEGLSKKSCTKMCISKPWCRGYTWSKDDSSGSICHMFKQLTNQHACDSCSQCLSGKVTPITGICSDKWIHAEKTEGELECVQLCAKESNCQFYSYAAGIFAKMCFLFSECNPVDTCEHFRTGQLECMEQPRSTATTQKPTTTKTTHVQPFTVTNSYNALLHTALVRKCEGRGNLILDCGNPNLSYKGNNSIVIVHGNYGRTNSPICPGENSNASNCCNCIHGLEKIKEVCNGKKKCELDASNSFFNTDPCKGIYKYLEVLYRCVETSVVGASKTG